MTVAKSAIAKTVVGGTAIALFLGELLMAALRPASIHRVAWMAPKLVVFLGAYLLARLTWLAEPNVVATAGGALETRAT